jgi:peptidoglycan/xylan/chitin deacetylase (PgdA/CDA1 family)
MVCALARPLFGGLGCILALHRVVPEGERSVLPSNRALEISPEDLRAVLRWLRKAGVAVVSLDEIPDRLRTASAPRFICLTFDDGYRDNLTYALPVLREFGAPFSVNVTNGFIDRTASVWWYFLETVVSCGTNVQFSWQDQVRRYSTATPSERNQALDAISTLIRGLGVERDQLIRVIAEASGIDPFDSARRLCLDWEELARLAAEPLVTIGAHTRSHHSLNRLSEAEWTDEVARPREELASRLGREIRHFAYPFGGRNAVDEREFAWAQGCGFSTMVTTRPANLAPADAASLHRLPRLTLSGNYPAVPSLRMIVSGVTAWRQRHADRRG